MKSFKACHAYFFYVFIGLTLWFLSGRCVALLCRIDECLIDVEGYPTVQARTDGMRYINQQWPVLNMSFNQLCAQTMSHFDWIQSMDLFLLPCNHVRVEILAHTPLYVVNSDYVVTATGDVLKKDLFESSRLKNLHTVFIFFDKQEPFLSATCKHFLLHVPPAFFDVYACEWKNDNNVLFYDKQQPRFAILFHPDQIPTNMMLQQCNTLKEELVARLVFELPRTQTWIADVRFKDQIIVSQEKRGVCHGTNI